MILCSDLLGTVLHGRVAVAVCPLPLGKHHPCSDRNATNTTNRAQGEGEEAVKLLEQALELCATLKDEDTRASTLCNLGAALMQVLSGRGCCGLDMHQARRHSLALLLSWQPVYTSHW